MKTYILFLFFLSAIIANPLYGQNETYFGQTPTLVKSIVNSSTATLNADSIFTGTGELNTYQDVMVNVSASHDGLLEIQFSDDDVTYYTIGSYNYRAGGVNRPHVFLKGSRYARVRFTNNSGSNQTSFSLNTHFGQFGDLTVSLNGKIAQDADALNVVTLDYTQISGGKVDGNAMIYRFGRNADVDAAEDIWANGGDYTGFPTAAAENFEVLSSNVADDLVGTGARTIRIWYLNDNYEMFDANGDMLTVDVDMDGTTVVDAGVSGMRVWRVKVINSGSGETNVGNITVRWATTESTVFCVVQAGVGQTELTSFTIPLGYTGYLVSARGTMGDATSNRAVVAMKQRDSGTGTFRLVNSHVFTTETEYVSEFAGGFPILEKTDFVFRARSVNNANGDISVEYVLRLERN